MCLNEVWVKHFMLSWDELCHATFGCVKWGLVRLSILSWFVPSCVELSHVETGYALFCLATLRKSYWQIMNDFMVCQLHNAYKKLTRI